jgi:hypothetical protein
MARRVHLHIGAPKTGTTYVQNALWNNHDALKRAGFLLPGTLLDHDRAMTDLREVPWRDAAATGAWERLAAESRKWSGDVIISSEGLGAATQEQAVRAVASLRPAEIHVIVAARDLWRTLPSMWQQSVRARSVWRFEQFLHAVETGRFEDFFEHHTGERMLRRWGDLLPPAHRHLVTVPAPGTPQDILWHRFAGIIGIPDGVCRLKKPSSNPSLGAAEIEVLRRVNQALGDRFPHRTPYREVVHRHLVDAVLKNHPNQLGIGVGLERADWVLDLVERQIKELSEYPCDIVGDLDELRPGAMLPTQSPDELSEGQVLSAAIETIVGMLGHADALTRPAPSPSYEEILSRLKRRAARGVRRGFRGATLRNR